MHLEATWKAGLQQLLLLEAATGDAAAETVFVRGLFEIHKTLAPQICCRQQPPKEMYKKLVIKQKVRQVLCQQIMIGRERCVQQHERSNTGVGRSSILPMGI
jgi:hypothetical protein